MEADLTRIFLGLPYSRCHLNNESSFDRASGKTHAERTTWSMSKRHISVHVGAMVMKSCFIVLCVVVSVGFTSGALAAEPVLQNSDPSLLQEVLREARETIHRIAMPVHKIELLEEILIAQAVGGDVSGAQETLGLFDEALNAIQKASTAYVIKQCANYLKVETRVLLAQTLAQGGDVQSAESIVTDAVARAQQIQNPYEQYGAWLAVAEYHLRTGQTQALNSAYARVWEAIALLPEEQEKKRFISLSVNERRAEIEILMGHHQAATHTIQQLLDPKNLNGWELAHLIDIAKLQAFNGNGEGARKTLQELFVLRNLFLPRDNSSERERWVMRYRFRKVVDLARVGVAMVRGGDTEGAKKLVDQALEAVKEIRADSGNLLLAWKSIGLAAANVGNFELALYAKQQTEGPDWSTPALPDLNRALLKANQVEKARKLAIEPNWKAQLAQIQTEMGDFHGAVQTVEGMKEEVYSRLWLETTRAMGRARAQVFGVSQTRQWVRKVKDPEARSEFLLGVADALLMEQQGLNKQGQKPRAPLQLINRHQLQYAYAHECQPIGLESGS